MAYIKNGAMSPNISHLSAVHWGCLVKEGSHDDRHRLDRRRLCSTRTPRTQDLRLSQA